MGKHLDELGSYQDFRAPWETETGDEAEVDKPKLKKLLFNARSAKAAALDERDEAVEAQKTAETERDEAKTEAANTNPAEAQKKIEKLEAENKTLKDAADARAKADEYAALRAEVIGDLDPKYAKYVTGEDRKALEESLEAVKADFGIKDSDDDDDAEDEPQLRTRPRSGLRNPGDSQPGKGGDEAVDFDKVADQILGSGPFG